MRRAKAIEFSENPLDHLIVELGGTGNVAELTGRKKRFVTDKHMRPRLERRDKGTNLLEQQAFMSGDKNVCIISDAASAGISLHSWRKALNQKKRVHIIVELPWAGDKTIQQMGRSHRSNQASSPEYKLLSSGVGSENRFITTVARRLLTLGALLNGDRQATVGGSWVDDMNVDNEYGVQALRRLDLLFAENRERVGG